MLSRMVRAGFTLIELLVVIAIIAVLIGLLLPAVQKVREAAARSTCSNNIKQIGLGLHNYHDTNRRLPWGYEQEVAGANRRRQCWYQEILPYVEQQALYNEYRNYPDDAFEIEYIHRLNNQISNTPVNTFSCPSDPSAPGRGANGGNNAFQGNYAVCAGIGQSPFAATPNLNTVQFANTNGMFGMNSKTKLTDVLDGTSNTLMISEGIIRGNGVGAWGELGGYWGGSVHGSVMFSAFELPNTTVPDRVYSCKSTTFPTAPCENGHAEGLSGRWNFARSRHPGGVNVGMGDASVRFVSNNVDIAVWRAAGTKDLQEVVNGEL